MVGCALEHVAFTRAADALHARSEHLDAGLLDRVEDRRAVGDGHRGTEEHAFVPLAGVVDDHGNVETFREEAHATIELAHRYDVAVMPGCFTPTEILTAWEAGADVIKVFPATTLGPGYIKDVKAPLPQVKLMPTGGVTLTNAGDWIKAGACAVGVGSNLVDARALEKNDFAQIAENARTVVASVTAARA